MRDPGFPLQSRLPSETPAEPQLALSPTERERERDAQDEHHGAYIMLQKKHATARKDCLPQSTLEMRRLFFLHPHHPSPANPQP